MQLVLLEWQMELGAFCSILLHHIAGEASPSHGCHLLGKPQRESSLEKEMWQNSLFPCPHPSAMAEREYPPGSGSSEGQQELVVEFQMCLWRCRIPGTQLLEVASSQDPSWCGSILHPSRSLGHCWQTACGPGNQDLGFRIFMDSHQLWCWGAPALPEGDPIPIPEQSPVAQPVL